MDSEQTGRLIRRLRMEQGMTQLQLAQQLHVSDKAVSKWETGQGCPDISLLGALAACFGISPERLLCGTLEENTEKGDNMKKLKFCVCPVCGNLLTTMADAEISCCGRKLTALVPREAEEGEKLTVEMADNEYYITSCHEMTKEHYISFAALVSADSVLLRRLYPEWGLEMRMPCFAHGTLYWYCTKHGLLYQKI